MIHLDPYFYWKYATVSNLSFQPLLARLLEIVRQRVRNGQISERSLARLLGMSQPHVHNILKGIRVLSPELADAVLSRSEINVLDLITPHELWVEKRDPEVVTVPFVDPGDSPASNGPGRSCGHMFSRHTVRGLEDPAVAILAADPSMLPRFEEGDLVLLERAEPARTRILGASCYLVSHNGSTLARYIRLGGSGLYLATEESLGDPLLWDFISLANRNILEIVRGRIVWIGRQVEAIGNQPAEEARGDDRCARGKR